jgi:hypothetical protein
MNLIGTVTGLGRLTIFFNMIILDEMRVIIGS